jgi:hypothetical protein
VVALHQRLNLVIDFKSHWRATGLGSPEQDQSSAAPIPAPGGFAGGTAAGTEPARSSGKPVLGFRLRIGSLRWLLEKPRSDPDSVSLLRARWLSILSMPSAPGSSCIGKDYGLTVAETWKILRPNTAGCLHSAGFNRSVSRRGECSIFPVVILC